jgi:alanine dehydrogenase
MIFVTEAQVRQHLPMREAVRLMRETFAALRAGTAINQPRRRLMVPTGAVMHSMAGSYGKYFGTKVYATKPGHHPYFFVMLYDSETAEPVAYFEANHLGQIRTGAATGYATDLLADSNAKSVAMIGSGFQAMTQLEAIREVRAVTDVRVWSRSKEKRETYAAHFSTTMGVRAVSSAQEAVEGADIIVTITNSGEPVFDAAWVKPGAHITAAGSNQPQRRELPPEIVLRANLIACDSIEQAKIEAGDLRLVPVDWSDPRIVELAQVERRPDGNPTTIFKSGGLGVEDVAVAVYLYEKLRN